MLALLLVDVVLVLQEGSGMREALAATRLPVPGPDVRAALVSFGGKVKVRHEFTADWESLNRALRRLAPPIQVGSRRGNPQEARVFLAIEQAAKLFPKDQARRAIILLFASEDWSNPAAARGAIESSRAKLYAATVRRRDPSRWIDPKSQTPPTIPGPVPPVPTGRAPLPEATAGIVAEMVKATGGEMTPGKWDLADLWRKAVR